MLKRFLVLMVALALLPSAARAQNDGAIAGLAFYSGIVTGACALFVMGAKNFADEEAAAEDDEEPEVDYSRRGFYLDGGFAYANGFSGSMAGPRVHAGYRCHPRFAADLEYEGLYIRDSQGFEGNTITSGPNAGKSDSADSYWKIAYNIKVFILTGRIQPFIAFGFGGASADRKYDGGTNRDFLINAGAGVDGWLTGSLALSLDAKYTALTGGASDLGNLTIGTKLKYMF